MPFLPFCRHLRLLAWFLVWGLMPALALLVPGRAFAHPMPNSMLVLDLQPTGVAAELQLPLGELQLAFGRDVARHPETLVAHLGPELRAYIQAHVRPVSPDGRVWSVAVGKLGVGAAEQTATGPYQELTAQLWLQPPAGASPRTFDLQYDVIIHQLVTHIALVAVRQDWEAGRVGEQTPTQVGVIRLDVVNNTVPALAICPSSGSRWQGFQGMVRLGMAHIAEGTDHLLFLLVLLLPAPLLAARGRWGVFGGGRYSTRRLLLVVTAFTLGHSLTLLAGAVGWLLLLSQPVEILIALSILLSAVHALRPLFAGREAWIAAGFGLVHGLAFAGTLAELHLTGGPLALSIFGFNLGIELMQLLVIGLTFPWLLLLSRTPAYATVRVAGAVFAAIAALAWGLERALAQANPVTVAVERVAQHAPWLLGALAFAALFSYWRARSQGSRSSVPAD